MPSDIAESLRPLAVQIDSLTLLPGNPRRGDIEAVARSYERFGQRKPIVARRDGTVIAGNHQLQAAQKLGWDEIAVVYVDDDDLTAKAFALADNRTGDLGTYDLESLESLLKEVALDDDLLFDVGYDSAYVEALSKVLAPPDLDELAKTIGEPTDEDRLRRVVLLLPPELEQELTSELKRIGSHEKAVREWLNL